MARTSRQENQMPAKPLLIATIATALSAVSFSTQVSADPVAGAVAGGTIGAIAGGPPGAVVGAIIGAVIGDDAAYRHGYYRDQYYYGRGYGYAPPAGYYR